MESILKKDTLGLALLIGELMLTNGAETYRVEDTVLRICKSRNFNSVDVFASPTVIIISDSKLDGFSFLKNIKSRSTDLNKISLLNDFSRKFVNNPEITIEEAKKELEIISNTNSYPELIQYIFTGIGCAFFATPVEGNNINTFFATFVTSIFAVVIYNEINEENKISSFASLIASSFIAFAGIILTKLDLINSPSMLIVGSIMPLLPGVAFIKGIRDLISGDLVSGVSLAFDAVITAISIACGVGIIFDIWLSFGGVL